MEDFAHYMREAEIATKENSHVAVLFYYRSAIESENYVSGTAPILFEAVKYAQKLKKQLDRSAIAAWGVETLGRMQTTSLAEIINQEIVKLQTGGKDATS